MSKVLLDSDGPPTSFRRPVAKSMVGISSDRMTHLSTNDGNALWRPRASSLPFSFPRHGEHAAAPTFRPYNIHKSALALPETTVIDIISIPSVATQEVVAMGEEAIATYESVRVKESFFRLEGPRRNPFSEMSVKELMKHYGAAVDVKNAIHVRKSAIGVDIGRYLEMMTAKCSMYEQDGATLQSALFDMTCIREACRERGLELDFYNLEFRRHITSLEGVSVMEKYMSLIGRMEILLAQTAHSQEAAEQFFEDPASLREHRLPLFGTSHR
ncbi:hypothetical protein BDN70DRAFT_937349 [Pholiota conissans]|uniref:Uncharacterized protein n=1 Tax=Pholiota conissans TaxID=109636 RepID=A0A9P6CVG3_9AGAR|nr:hypothetical protein BDN70DRAFT_937349 [Pholiota conissans]